MWALLAIIVVGIAAVCICSASRHYRRVERTRYKTRSIRREDALRYLKLNMHPIESNDEMEKKQKAYVNDIVTKKHKQSFVRMDSDQ